MKWTLVHLLFLTAWSLTTTPLAVLSSDLASHLLFIPFFQLSLKYLLKYSLIFYFLFCLTSYFPSIRLRVAMFLQKTTTKMTKYWTFIFQPFAKREPQFWIRFSICLLSLLNYLMRTYFNLFSIFYLKQIWKYAHQKVLSNLSYYVSSIF